MSEEQNTSEETQIHVDSDWKAQAQAEKDKLVEAEQKVEDKTEERKLPLADFRGLMGILASQAMMGLGAQKDPTGNGVMVDLEGAKYTIDLLTMMQEKTEGNLSEEEATELKQLLQELQSRFVQIAQMVAEQMQAGNAGTPTEQPSGIIDPTS